MAAGDVKIAYAASANLTVNNGLESLASSATWVVGWESTLVDNTTNLYLDYMLSGKFTGNHTAPTAGQIRVYVAAMLDDTTWPDTLDGTGSAETITLTTLAQICRLAAVIATNTDIDAVYGFGPVSVANLFGGQCPAKFIVFVAHSMVQTLAASGQQITVKGVYNTVAAS